MKAGDEFTVRSVWEDGDIVTERSPDAPSGWIFGPGSFELVETRDQPISQAPTVTPMVDLWTPTTAERVEYDIVSASCGDCGGEVHPNDGPCPALIPEGYPDGNPKTRLGTAKFDTGAEPMTVQTFETVWDAIADTPEQAANMRLRSDLLIASDSLRDSTAAKFDTGKSPLSLIPRDAQLAEADVLAFGAKKYAAHNWRKGMNWSRLGDAAMRHLLAWLDGEDVDPETGLSHLAHLRCCAGFLLTYQARGLGTDDRHTA